MDAQRTLSETTRAHLDRRLRTAQRTHRLPSVVAAVFRDGTTLWSGAAGLVGDAPPTSDTQYRIGSITKTMVAVAVMRLRDEGLLALSDPVALHLPAGGGAGAAVLERVSVGQLLMHAAGVPAETVGPWWERAPGTDLDGLLGDLAGRGPAGLPGQRFHYSNVGFGVLGGVLAHRRGTAWEVVVRDEVLRPLGMTRTTPRPEGPAAPGLAVHPWADTVLAEPEHDAGAMAPAGQLWSTVTDLARWGRFLGGETAGVLAPATLAEMSVPGMVSHVPGEPWDTAHGLGLQVFNLGGSVSVGHGGSMPGFLALVRADPATSTGVCMMTNSTAGPDRDLPGDLLDLLERHDPVDGLPWTPSPVADDVADLLGIWYWGPRPHRLVARGDELELAPLEGPGRTSRFTREADGFVGRDDYYAGEVLRAVRRPDGTVSHLDLASFVFTRSPYDPQADVPGGVDPAGWR